MNKEQTRKIWLDNIRWCTIVLVMIFHVFFFFNNIGVAAIFHGLPDYVNGAAMRPDAIYQYAVYPWFMTLLFIVSGIAAKCAIDAKGTEAFRKNRINKLLVPSTLGVLVLGWIPGSMVARASMETELVKQTPAFVRYIIYTLSGIGALWFLQVLFIASMLLLAVIKISSKTKQPEKHHSANTMTGYLLIIMVFPVLWGTSKLLNTPLVESYRFGIYITSFFLGYYLFSQENIMIIIRKIRFISLAAAIISGIIFIRSAYGIYYGHSALLSTWQANLYTYTVILAILGIFSEYFDHSSRITRFCGRISFPVYVLHIPVILVLLTIMDHTAIPYIYKVLILTAGVFTITPLLGMLVEKIPVVRYLILGIKRRK